MRISSRLLPFRRSRSAPPTLHRNCALFLDIDRTLVEDAKRPELVRIDPALMSGLPRIAAELDHALALITGRSVTGVDKLFPQLRLPIAGQHGSERRGADGTIHLSAPDKATFATIRGLLETLAGNHEGLVLENKGSTLALHYREAPRLAPYIHRVLRSTLEDVGNGAYGLQPGKRMLEVRPGSRDKGTAIIEFMGEAPFEGRLPVFLGDDKADEFGFAVVEKLGGWSVKVGPGRSSARYRLKDIPSVHRWLLAPLVDEGSEDHSGNDHARSRPGTHR